MTQPEPRNPPTANSRYPHKTETQEDNLKPNRIKMINAFKEEMTKFLEEIQENTTKEEKDMKKKTVQD